LTIGKRLVFKYNVENAPTNEMIKVKPYSVRIKLHHLMMKKSGVKMQPSDLTAGNKGKNAS